MSTTTRARSARIRPSPSSASSSAPRAPRPCGAPRKFSSRSSAHFTGRASCSAASAASGASTGSVPLEPKPPPTSGTTTRTDRSSRPSDCASCARGRCALCAEQYIVSSCGCGSTTTPRGSSGTAASRGSERSTRTIRAARENAPVTSPHDTREAEHRRPRARVDDRLQRLVVDNHPLGQVLCGSPRLGHHRGDRLADVAHLVRGQQRMRHVGDERPGHGVHGERRRAVDEVGGRDHRQRSGAWLHGMDQCMRERTAHDCHVRELGQHDVVEEPRPPA